MKQEVISSDYYNSGNLILLLERCEGVDGKDLVLKEVKKDQNYQLLAEIDELAAFQSTANSQLNKYLKKEQSMAVSKALFFVESNGERLITFEKARGVPISKVISTLKENPRELRIFLTKLGNSRGRTDLAISKLYSEKDDIGFSDINSVVHGDFHQDNIFYDRETDTFTVIDNSGFVFSAYDPKSATEIIMRDIKKLCEVVGALFQLEEQCLESVLRGYGEVIPNSPQLEELLFIVKQPTRFDFAE